MLIVERGAVLAPSVVVANADTSAGQCALEFARMIADHLGWEVVTVTPDAAMRAKKSQLLVVPAIFAITACGDFRGAVVVVP